jgi:glycosyltransferase involved in cell wall biosynthesis
MRIVLFAHPSFLAQQSMPRFTNMLAEGMRQRGYEVAIYSPEPRFFKLPAPGPLKKWLGYIDQFIIFPAIVKKRIKNHKDTLYIFTDHALGMWVPIIKHLPHVIICHDFLAQRSAKGGIPQNPTGWSGRIYQQLICNGYVKGANFISVSKKTQQDLHGFLGKTPAMSKVVYNGLNNNFTVIDVEISRQSLSKKTRIDLCNGYVLHVGGNQWYKNRTGVVKIYNEWRKTYNNDVPLLLIGSLPSPALDGEIEDSPYRASIYALTDIDDGYVNMAYSGASALLFPSYAEGFGWPIAEAMAAGCTVITTNEAPMTEVGGEAAIYIPVQPLDDHQVDIWAKKAARILNRVISLPDTERLKILAKGFENAQRFNTDNALDEFENAFGEILA